MFEKKTVVIMGAGASAGYGFPLGESLVDRIKRTTTQIQMYDAREEDSPVQRPRGSHSLPFSSAAEKDFLSWLVRHRSYLELNVVTPGELIDVGNLGEHIELGSRLAKTAPLSIDGFLASNPDLERVGKLHIAHEIIHSSLDVRELFPKMGSVQLERPFLSPTQKIQNAAKENDWSQRLCGEIVNGCKSAEQLEQTELSFVTFNYDNVIEAALELRIKSHQMYRDVDVAQLFPVHHVYGKVANDLKVDNVKDMRLALAKAITSSSEDIRTFHESQDSKEVDMIRHLLREAEVIYVFGFSFDDPNVELLGLGDVADKCRVQNYGGNGLVSRRMSDIGIPGSRFTGSIPDIIANGFLKQ